VDLVEVAPLVFARPDGNTTIAGISHFIFTNGGNGTYYHGDAIPQYYERLPWYATPAGVTKLGYLCLAVFASVVLTKAGNSITVLNVATKKKTSLLFLDIKKVYVVTYRIETSNS
jgi:uncharacterized membrane protein